MPDKLKLKLFLAHSFAPQRVNAQGDGDPTGHSDMQLADLVAKWITEFSQGRIEVIRTIDPYHDYISSSVRRAICGCDVFLCLFTKRARLDDGSGLWLTSTYVISEAAAALMQFPSEGETHARLFGLRERGVDAGQLGMAFPKNKVLPEFSRDNLDGLRDRVREIVEHVCGSETPKRDTREYLSVDKVVSIWRNGSVIVECRHRFRFTEEMATVRIPHTMWRISSALPELNHLLHRRGSRNSEFLRCVPLSCGHSGQNACRYRIHPRPSADPHERNFDVEFSNVGVKPGDELSYEIAWAYKNAFQDPSKLGGLPNSVGLRTGDRGIVQSASLTLRFQRDLDEEEGEHGLILEERPQVSVIGHLSLPAARDRVEFWHHGPGWRPVATLEPCPKLSGAIFEVYRWKMEQFAGMAKVTWNPRMNYLQEELSSQPGSNAEPPDTTIATPAK